MDSLPLVSILINNYNYDRFLAQAIDSALGQTYPHLEVIVVDDGSTDSSQEIIRSYGDRIIPVLKENGGQSSALNAGFEHSKGDLLCFLDADDVFLPSKVEKFVDWFQQMTSINPKILMFNALEIIDEKGSQLDLDPLSGSCEWKDLHGNVAREKLLDGILTQISTAIEVYRHANKYRYIPYLASPTSGLVMTRTLAVKIFPLPWKNIKTSGDDFLVKAASLLGDIYSTDAVLTQYRVHGHNNWYGYKKSVKKEFLCAVDEFLNLKLEQNGKKPIFSYFNSAHAQVYYRGIYNDYRSYSKELLKLAIRVVNWHVDQRTIKLLIKAIQLVIYSKLGVVNTLNET